MKSNPKILLHLAAVCHCNLVPFFVYLMLIRISKLHLYLKPISIAPFAAYTHISCSHYTCRQRNFALLDLPSINCQQYAHVLSFFVRHFAEMCKHFRVHKGQRRNALKQSNKMGKNLRCHLNFVIKRNFAQKGQHQ